MITQRIIDFLNDKQVVDYSLLVRDLICCDASEICKLIMQLPGKEITAHNIPQYSDYENGTCKMIEYLRMSGDYGPSFVEVGKHFLISDRKEGAYRKYGENHCKLAELLGLVQIKRSKQCQVFLSELGRNIERLEKENQEKVIELLGAKIPVVQYLIRNQSENYGEVEAILGQYLASKTVLRRKRNTWNLVELLRKDK